MVRDLMKSLRCDSQVQLWKTQRFRHVHKFSCCDVTISHNAAGDDAAPLTTSRIPHLLYWCTICAERPPFKPQVDPGERPGPLRCFQNHAVFKAILRGKPYFQQILGSGPPGIKTLLALLTKILDPPLQAPFMDDPLVWHPSAHRLSCLDISWDDDDNDDNNNKDAWWLTSAASLAALQAPRGLNIEEKSPKGHVWHVIFFSFFTRPGHQWWK